MGKELSDLSSSDVGIDIKKYLFIPIEHSKQIIAKLQALSENEFEKEHVIDILKECLHYQKDMFKLEVDYIDNQAPYVRKYILSQIESSVKNLFLIEDELIADYPNIFKNDDGEWWKYSQESDSPEEQKLSNNKSEFVSATKWASNYQENKWIKINQFKTKKMFFGLLFLLLFPIYIFYVFHPWLDHKIKNDTYGKFKFIEYEYDRPYRNIFYIYSAIISSDIIDGNFYTLVRSKTFKIPEGLSIIDKNLIGDYRSKSYYKLSTLDDDSSISVLSVNNLNYIECRYIVTKFSSLDFESAYLNNEILNFSPGVRVDDFCLSDNKRSNSFSVHIKKII